MFRFLTFLLLLSLTGMAHAQSPMRMTSSEIYEALQKVQFLGSALYVAAHPDDENTRLISYLSNDLHAEVAYLSLTRGDGGQNLIGNELQELLGVIRTQELLAARRLDGGRQFFSRANDFGFSKHPDETLRLWNRDEVLGDVVWTLRQWRPDIVINRFDHESAGKTHGHHTSSAILSVEAFDLANDPTAYPEQLKYTEPWQPRRLFFNTSWWFYGSREAFADADKSQLCAVETGGYLPLKGMSNSEIAALSRSQHRCQGMGRELDRGGQTEYLQLLKGDLPADVSDLFEGIDVTWNRVPGGAPIAERLQRISEQFDFAQPANSLPALVEVYRMVKALPGGHWKRLKQPELEQLILACAGLYLEATAAESSAAPGERVELTMEVVNRAPFDLQLERVEYLPFKSDTTLSLDLTDNQQFKFYKTVTLPSRTAYTAPYWLNDNWALGMYTVPDQAMRGKPETPRALAVRWHLRVGGELLKWRTDVHHKKIDPKIGEVYRPFEVLPPVSAALDGEVYIYPDNAGKSVSVTVTAGKANIRGVVTIAHPNGWTLSPEQHAVQIDRKGATETYQFELRPPAEQSEGLISPIVTLDNGESYIRELIEIEYDHIPTQSVLRKEKARVVRIDLKRKGDRVGYIMGAGDRIPESLRAIGYQVDLLEDSDITADRLKQYDAIITGIRAYNTREKMVYHQPLLLDYVQQGGNLIVQYNTTWRMPFPKEELAPYPLKLSRDRVTLEEAEVRFLASDHPALNQPNAISARDFEGWVMERGLYFSNEWDERYTALLSANDPGEDPKNGGLLVAPYGEGNFVYTGYSWFRQLPAGVPGAFRLFANLISLE